MYALSVADAFVRAGNYQRVLVVGCELQSTGIDCSSEGRDVAVLFGDGAGDDEILHPVRIVLTDELVADSGREVGDGSLVHRETVVLDTNLGGSGEDVVILFGVGMGVVVGALASLQGVPGEAAQKGQTSVRARVVFGGGHEDGPDDGVVVAQIRVGITPVSVDGAGTGHRLAPFTRFLSTQAASISRQVGKEEER